MRVVEGFSTAWRDVPFYGPRGSVLDVPVGLAEAASHLFERVDATVPLHLVEPVAKLPR